MSSPEARIGQPSIVVEADRILKLLRDEEEIVTPQGAVASVEVTLMTKENGKVKQGSFHEQYGMWLTKMRTHWESMRDLHGDWTRIDKEQAASQFVEAYRLGKTYRYFEVGEVKRLRTENANLTETLADKERRLGDYESEVGRLEERIKFLEETLTKNGISFGGAQSSVT